jgi:biopolymer transport protein TolR
LQILAHYLGNQPFGRSVEEWDLPECWAMLRAWHKSTQVRCTIDVSAFVSVMIALLFAVMTPSLFTDMPTVAVEFAKTNHDVSMRAAGREDALVIAVTRDGKIFFDNSQVVKSQDLPLLLRKRIEAGAPGTAYIKADARAHYRVVARALDSVRDAGVEKIALITESRQRSLALFTR